MKKYALVIMSALATFSGVADTAETQVWGAFSVNCPENSDTYIGVIATRPAVFKGVVGAISDENSMIAPTVSANWSANQFVYDGSTQLNHFYVKFTSGAMEGAWFDVISNTSDALEIFISSGELAQVEQGDTFEIIPHWTMQTLFPDGAGFTKSTRAVAKTGATILWKNTTFGEDGVEHPVGINNAFKASYYYRSRGTDVGWRDGDRFSADDAVVEPNTFIMANQPSGENAVVTYMGVIPMCATSFELFVDGDGEEFLDQDNYLVVPSAVDMTLSELTDSLVLSGAFEKSTGAMPKAIDMMYIYSNEQTGTNLTPTHSVYYRQRGTTDSWLDENRNNADNLILKAGTALVIQKKTFGESRIVRCTYKPKYTF